jgi:von Willebrand factor
MLLIAESVCAYTLLKETRDGLFTISVQNDPSCKSGNASSASRCPRVICIYVQGKEYVLSAGETGLPEFRSDGKKVQVPTQQAHVRVEPAAGGQALVAYLDAVGLTIRWDGATLLQLEAAESIWNRTAGLCGTLNGYRDDDLGPMMSVKHLANDWKIDGIGGRDSLSSPSILEHGFEGVQGLCLSLAKCS